MNAITTNRTEEPSTIIIDGGISAKVIYRRLSGRLLAFFLALFLLMVFNPVEASQGNGRNNKKCGHKVVKSTTVYPIFNKSDKRSPGFGKNVRKARNKNFSFPV
jgi:hypothetical protein